MKKISIIFMVLLSLATIVSATPVNPGSIWTTNGDCGTETQDVNHYAHGDVVYINGKNFNVNSYNWDITGQPGGASCDPNVAVVSGTHTVNSDGTFCFAAYTVANDDCGVYKVSFNNKNDNYSIDEDQVPEFGLIAGSLAIAGAGAGYLFLRRKN